MTAEAVIHEKMNIIDVSKFVSNLLKKINGEIAIGSINMLSSFTSLELSYNELTMWRTYATTRYCCDTERYRNECLPIIPVEVIAFWDHAREVCSFDTFEVFSSEYDESYEYILIGCSEKKYYLLARWNGQSSELVRSEYVLERTKEKLRTGFTITELPIKARVAIHNFQMSSLSPIVYLEHENKFPLVSRVHCHNKNLVFRIDTSFMETELYDICPDCGCMILMKPKYLHK